MIIVLKDKEEAKEQEQLIEKLIVEYKSYLNHIDDWVFESRGIHLDRTQLSYIALCVEQTCLKNRDKSKKDLVLLMGIAGVKAVCEMLCIELPDEIEVE